MSRPPDHLADLPSEATLARATQLWRRIAARFELSSIWRSAPPELVATEFLSLLRFALAPCRVEAAIYDRSLDTHLIAATLPPILVPQCGIENGPPSGFHFDTGAFFRDGGLAAEKWYAGLPENEDWTRVVKEYREYLISFKDEPMVFPLGGGSIFLHLLVDRPYSTDRVRILIASSRIHSLLFSTCRRSDSFHNSWQPLSRRLRDYLLNEFLSRLESDLAILTGADTPDIWVLLLDKAETTLQFHAPRHKLEQFLKHYAEYETKPTVGALRRQIEGEKVTGDLNKYLAPCQSKLHNHLEGRWLDSEELTVDHLECIAEKFQGWPYDLGIAGSVAATGCAETVINFAKDYRVTAYSYSESIQRESHEPEDFYRIRLAERAFIKLKTNPHLIELPLLWGADPQGSGRCTALLLLTFDRPAGENIDNDYFAQKALSVRNAVEPWYLLFEQHGRQMEWHSVIHGHIVHEVRNAFEGIKQELKEIKSKSLTVLETRLELLWSAYSFVRDPTESKQIRRFSIPDFLEFVHKIATGALEDERRFSIVLEPTFPAEITPAGMVEIADSHISYLLAGFFQQSIATLGNLHSTVGLKEDESMIVLRASSKQNVLPGQECILLNITHRVTPGVSRFIKKNSAHIGQAPIEGADRRRHTGLFYLGVLLRGRGGDFLQPVLDQHERTVTWFFAFPLVQNAGIPPTAQ